MRKREVIISPEARADLVGLYDYIAGQSGSARAISYVGRLEEYCFGFELVAERGARRDYIRPGLRTVGFERRVTIAFHVDAKRVTIDRVFYGGREIERALTATPPS